MELRDTRHEAVIWRFSYWLGAPVLVIDTTSNTVPITITIRVGDEPFGVAVTPGGRRTYVADLSDVSVIDTSGNTAGRLLRTIACRVLSSSDLRPVAHPRGPTHRTATPTPARSYDDATPHQHGRSSSDNSTGPHFGLDNATAFPSNHQRTTQDGCSLLHRLYIGGDVHAVLPRVARDTGHMRIAMAQISGSSNPTTNRTLVTERIAQAADGGAAMVVFPESTLRRGETVSEPPGPTAETLDGPFVSHLSELARRYNITVMAGMTERIAAEQMRACNTIVVVDNIGRFIGSYRKIHMFDALGIIESDTIVAGDGSTLVFPFGKHVIGVATCYDLRFPELARVLVDQGANVLIYPSAWHRGPLKEDHWEVLLRARAIENVSWVIGVNHAEGRNTGRSMAIDPMGVIIAGLAEEPGLGFVDINVERTDSARRQNPSLSNRRFGVHLTHRSDHK